MPSRAPNSCVSALRLTNAQSLALRRSYHAFQFLPLTLVNLPNLRALLLRRERRIHAHRFHLLPRLVRDHAPLLHRCLGESRNLPARLNASPPWTGRSRRSSRRQRCRNLRARVQYQNCSDCHAEQQSFPCHRISPSSKAQTQPNKQSSGPDKAKSIHERIRRSTSARESRQGVKPTIHAVRRE